MAPGRDWIITDIDEDAVAAAEAAAVAAALPVDEWMRRAIVEAYRREALTPPANAADLAAEPDAEATPETAAAADEAADSEPTGVVAPATAPVTAPAATPEPAAAPAGPPARPYQPISPGTARAIRVGRFAIGALLLLVVGAIVWNSQELWLGGGEGPDESMPGATAEPDLVTLPTEQVPVRPAHEAPDPQETERTFAERQAAAPPDAPAAEPDTAPNEATIVDETTAAGEQSATPEETETPTTAEEAPVTDPGAMPETEAPAPAEEVAIADPFAPDASDAERVPDAGPVGTIMVPDEAASGSQVAARTPPRSASEDDVPESVAAFVEAAEAGDPDAQHDLALIYIQGLGVPRDPEAAAHWFGEAALQGNANAQYNLGVMYEQGLGVPQDRIEALLLYLTAAEQGHVAAQYNAGLAYAEGNSIPRDFAEAHRWFAAAAEQGLAEAQYNLGIIYENGLGREKDNVAAFRHYSQAAQSGHQEAASKLAKLSARLTPAQRAEAEQAAEAPPPGATEKDMSRLDRGGIREVQQLLKTLGYETGTPDGLSGGQTTAAIRAYQQSAGLIVDGKPTAALLEHLRDATEQ